jgi:hypothetical protein
MKNNSLILASLCGVVLLTGCTQFWKKNDIKNAAPASRPAAQVDDATNPVLLTIDGTPVLRKAEFLDFCQQAMKANPYLASFGIVSYETAPEPIKKQLFDAVVGQKLITCWGVEKNVENSAEYQDMYAKMADQLRQALISQSFEKEIFEAITVSDEEILEEFNRSRDQMIKDPGSVTVVGVSFSDEEKAKVFFDLVARKEEATLARLAKESNVDVTDLGTISLDLRAPATAPVTVGMKRALSVLKDGEYYAQAREGNEHWVLQVVDRVKPTYLSFDEVKEQVATQVRHEKFKVVREARVNELHNAHKVEIDDSSLAGGQDPFALLQQMLAGQGGMTPEILEELQAAAQAEEAQAEEAQAEETSRPTKVSA